MLSVSRETLIPEILWFLPVIDVCEKISRNANIASMNQWPTLLRKISPRSEANFFCANEDAHLGWIEKHTVPINCTFSTGNKHFWLNMTTYNRSFDERRMINVVHHFKSAEKKNFYFSIFSPRKEKRRPLQNGDESWFPLELSQKGRKISLRLYGQSLS